MHTSTHTYTHTLPQSFDPSRASEYHRWGQELNANTRHADGVHHFHDSDYTSVYSGGSLTTLKMFSNRMYNNEVCNDEGLRSWHTASGALFTYRTGREYNAVFPVWDWTRIPGTTTRRVRDESSKKVRHMGLTSFVGGLSDSVISYEAEKVLSAGKAGDD